MVAKYDIEWSSSDDEYFEDRKVTDFTDDGSSTMAVTVERGGQKLASVKNTTVLEVLSGLLAAASVASSVGAMILSPVNIVYAAGGLSWWVNAEVYSIMTLGIWTICHLFLYSFIGPYAFFQQKRLTDLIALQETHDAISAEIKRLSSKRRDLHEAIWRLRDRVDRLEDAERALDAITNMQGMSIEALEEHVIENRDILWERESQLKTSVMQNLFKLALHSDRNRDSIIDDEEVDIMIEKIEDIEGVRVDGERLKREMKKGGCTFKDVMNIIKELVSHGSSEENELFVFEW